MRYFQTILETNRIMRRNSPVRKINRTSHHLNETTRQTIKTTEQTSLSPSLSPSIDPRVHQICRKQLATSANARHRINWNYLAQKGAGEKDRETRDCKETAGESKHGKRGKSGQKSSDKTLYIYIYIKEKYRKERKNSERLLIKAFLLVSTSPVVSLPRRLYPVQTETRYYLDSPESNRRDTSRSYV